MTRAECVYEKLESKDGIFEVMNKNCPSDFELEDDCNNLLDADECFRCWMREVKE